MQDLTASRLTSVGIPAQFLNYYADDVFKERGEMLLLNFAKGLEEVGKPDEMPRLEGKRMSIIFSPKVVKK